MYKDYSKVYTERLAKMKLDPREFERSLWIGSRPGDGRIGEVTIQRHFAGCRIARR